MKRVGLFAAGALVALGAAASVLYAGNTYTTAELKDESRAYLTKPVDLGHGYQGTLSSAVALNYTLRLPDPNYRKRKTKADVFQSIAVSFDHQKIKADMFWKDCPAEDACIFTLKPIDASLLSAVDRDADKWISPSEAEEYLKDAIRQLKK